MDPELVAAADGDRGALVWTADSPIRALTSAPVGGGFGNPGWIMNIGVPLRYTRTDLDAHVAEVADRCGLDGPGIGMLTAASIERWQRGDCDGVVADVTVGISKPTWAADPDGGWSDWQAGTINLVVQVPVPLDPGAAVNAVMTATEAKTQALLESGVPGTGTASDAVAVAWPMLGTGERGAPTERFAGPRSRWGARIALASHAAVLAALAAVER